MSASRLNPVEEIPLEKIKAPALYVREQADGQHVGFLADDIRKRGLLEPLLVRAAAEGLYEIINGVHRFSALKSLGSTTAPCTVVQASNQQAMMMQLLTNYRTRRLRDYELVRAVATMHDQLGMRLDAIASDLGYSKGYVSKLYSLWKDRALYQQLRDGVLTLKGAYERTKNQQSFPGKPDGYEVKCFVCGRYGDRELYVRPAACSAHADYLTLTIRAARTIFGAKKEAGLKWFSERIEKAADEVLDAETPSGPPQNEVSPGNRSGDGRDHGSSKD